MTERPESHDRAPHYSAEDVRGGEIILRTPLQRAIFIAGLVGFVVFAFIVGTSAG